MRKETTDSPRTEEPTQSATSAVTLGSRVRALRLRYPLISSKGWSQGHWGFNVMGEASFNIGGGEARF